MPGDSPLELRVHARLRDLASEGLLRTLAPPSGIDLSSNDYLNLSRHPRICAAFVAGVERDGAGSTGSRLLRGERLAFSELEHEFARFKHTERSLFFSSGYLANLAVLSALTEPGDVVFSDERNHASLIDGVRLSRARTIVAPHNNPTRLSQLLEETPCEGLRFVAIESLYSMDGDIASLGAYVDVCRSYDAVLIVDEAHAIGVFGARGSGLLEQAGVDANRCLSINTAGKALGVAGAFVAGPAWAVEYLIQRARPFVFSTAPPPAVAAALQASLQVVADEPGRRATLLARAAYVRARFETAGVDIPDGISPIIPVIVGDNDRAVTLARAMQAEGFDVRAIRPPTVPAGTARLRISVNADLSESTLDRFAGVLAHAMAPLSSHP